MHELNRSLESQKVTLVGGIVNLGLSIVKIITGIFGHSQSLIADGVHSLSDLLSDVMVWFAIRRSHEKPDVEHPYGHGRFETVATLGLGIFLVVIAVSITFDAIVRLFIPESLLVPKFITLVIALISILTKEVMYWYTIVVAKRHDSNMLKANAWHHRSDAVSSVIVLVGIAGTMAGLAYLDAVAAIVVGIMLIYIGYELGRPALDELVDKGFGADDLNRLKAKIIEVDGVQSLHILRTRKLGPHFTADLHIQVDPFLSVSEGHMVSVAVEETVKQSNLGVNDVIVHIDPEDDENDFASRNLPQRKTAINIINQTLDEISCREMVEHIRLHYLDGRIYADLYLPLRCLDNIDGGDLTTRICDSLEKVEPFARPRVFFGDND